MAGRTPGRHGISLSGHTAAHAGDTSADTPAAARTGAQLVPRRLGDLIGTRRYVQLRRQLLAASGWRCAACGDTRTERLELDHIRPRRMGGAEMDPTNLQVLCADCNQAKGSSMMTLDDIRAATARPAQGGIPWHFCGPLPAIIGETTTSAPLPSCEAAGCNGGRGR